MIHHPIVILLLVRFGTCFVTYSLGNVVLPIFKNTRFHDTQTDYAICQLQYELLKEYFDYKHEAPVKFAPCPFTKWKAYLDPYVIAQAVEVRIILGIASGLPDVYSSTAHDALYHFDNDRMLKAANERLIRETDNLIKQVQLNEMTIITAAEIRQKLGMILHTLQDFYSHTNWVESKQEGIAENIGFSHDFKLPLNEATRPACKDCDTQMTSEERKEFRSIANNFLYRFQLNTFDWKPKNVYVCRDNIILNDYLHTGYVGGQLLDGKNQQCGHGGGSDTSSRSTPRGGINKDGESLAFSPHYYLHQEAAEKSVEATLFYLRTLRTKINNDIKWAEILGLHLSKSKKIYDIEADEFLKLPVTVKLLQFDPLKILFLKLGQVAKIENGTFSLVLQCEECETIDHAVLNLNGKEMTLPGKEQQNPHKTWDFGIFRFQKDDKLLIRKVKGIGYRGFHTRRNLASFSNPAYAYFPSYALMRNNTRRGSSAPPPIIPRIETLPEPPPPPAPDYLPDIPDCTGITSSDPTILRTTLGTLSTVSDLERLKLKSAKTKSYATVFAALFIFVLIVAITFLVGLALLTDGFKHLTVEERCKDRWTTLASSGSEKTKSVISPVPHPSHGYSHVEQPSNGLYSRSEHKSLPPSPPSVHPPSQSSSYMNNVCLTPDCVRIASNILTSMNPKEDPCDNFYEFACGGYTGIKQVPESEKKISVFSEARTRLKYEIRELLDDYSSREEKSDAAKLVYIYYDSCMDDQAQDSLDLMPIFSLFSSLGGWALLQNAKFEDKDFRWESLESQLRVLGIDGLLRLSVKGGHGANSTKSLVIGSPRLLLGDKDLYLSNIGRNEVLLSYRTYMVELLELFGADSEAMEPDVNAILDFERGLANITSSSTTEAKAVKLNIKSLKDEVSKIWWKDLFNGALMDLLPNFNDFSPQIYVDMNYLKKLQRYLTTANPQTINDYMMWKVLTSFDSYLPQRYREPHETLNSVLKGSTVKPLWEECVNEVVERIPLPLASLYSKWYLANKRTGGAGIEKLLTDLKIALQQTVLNADWMDESTRTAAIAKLKKLRIGVDIAKSLPNENIILQPYTGVRLVGSTYFDNNLALRKAKVRNEFKELRQSSKPMNEEIGLLSDLVPLHRYLQNEVVIPSGLLQFPFFVADAPNSWGCGSLASLIAREIAHAFDDYGAQFDETGQRRFWWKEETERFFESKKQCFIAQYDSKNDPISGKKLDGRKTLRENIADNGALRMAYAAYNQRVSQHSENLLLPALNNFTDHQLFFLAFANTYCESVKVNSAQQLLDSELTSPGVFRVNVPLQNFPAFSQAFNCEIGTTMMNPYEKCRIW